MSITTTSGCVRLDRRDRLGAVGALGDDREVVLGAEDPLQPGAHQVLVVDEDDADHPSAPAISRSGGSSADTRHPSPTGPACDRAAHRAGPLLHPDQPEAARSTGAAAGRRRGRRR